MVSRVLAGTVVSNAGWERGGPNGEVRASIVPEGEHFRANGVKYYSTGALFADWVRTVVVDPDGQRVSITVPRDREGLRLVDDWGGIGQRRARRAGFPADLVTAVSVEVATAQFGAVAAALRAGELALDVGDGSATDRRHNLDRHWRNARTVANHNPHQHKAAAVGAYHLTGEQPPISGLF